MLLISVSELLSLSTSLRHCCPCTLFVLYTVVVTVCTFSDQITLSVPCILNGTIGLIVFPVNGDNLLY